MPSSKGLIITNLTPGDAVEVVKFRQYLLDKSALNAEEFKAKWSGYEQGLCEICGAEMPCHCNDMEGLG